MSRAPSLKRKDTSGERESLLSGEGRGSFEDEEPEGIIFGKARSASGGSLHHPGSLDFPELPTLPSLCPSGEHHDCNGRALHLSTELPSELSREDSPTEEDLDDVSKHTAAKTHKHTTQYTYSMQSHLCKDITIVLVSAGTSNGAFTFLYQVASRLLK